MRNGNKGPRRISLKNTSIKNAYQDFIDWVMKNTGKYRVIKSSGDDIPEGYEITVFYRPVKKKRSVKSKPRIRS